MDGIHGITPRSEDAGYPELTGLPEIQFHEKADSGLDPLLLVLVNTGAFGRIYDLILQILDALRIESRDLQISILNPLFYRLMYLSRLLF